MRSTYRKIEVTAQDTINPASSYPMGRSSINRRGPGKDSQDWSACQQPAIEGQWRLAVVGDPQKEHLSAAKKLGFSIR